MSFFGNKAWICEFFCPTCPSPVHKILKPFCNTFCIVYKVLCGTSKDLTNLAEMNFADHPLPGLTSISATQAPNLVCNDNKCEIKDYFDIWLQETSSKVFSQTSRKKLFQTGSYSHWYDIFYYMKCWWTEVIKRLYSLVTCLAAVPWVSAEVTNDVIPEEITLFETKIEPSTEIESFSNENSFYFLVLYCIIGGLCLITLLNRKRVKFRQRKASLLSPSDIKEIEVNVIQKLIKFLKENKSIQEKLKNNFEENYCNFTNSIKSLEKKRGGNIEPKKHESNLTRRYLLEEEQAKQKRFTQEQISKAEKQCKIYQNQIRVMEEQLHELLKNHRFEVKKYFTKYQKVELELGKTQNRLDLSYQLHKTETAHLQEYIAQLQAQYENINEFNIQRLICRRSLQGYQNDLQSVEDVCVEPQHNLIENLNKSLSALVKPSGQNPSTDNYKTLEDKCGLEDAEDDLRLPEESYIKPNPSQITVQLQRQYINNNIVNTQEKDEELQLIEGACMIPTCDNGNISLVKVPLQVQYKNANTFRKAQYNLQHVPDDTELEKDFIVLKRNCSGLCKPLSGKMMLQTQHNKFEPRERKWSEDNLQLTESGIKPKRKLSRGLTKPPSEVSLEIQFEADNELAKDKVNYDVLDSQNGLQLTGAAHIKLKKNFSGISKPSIKTPLQTQFKTTNTSVTQQKSHNNLQLKEESCINLKCNLKKVLSKSSLAKLLFQSEYSNSEDFNTMLDEYSLESDQDDLHLTEETCIEPKSNFARNTNKLSSLSTPFQAQCENFIAFEESDDEDEYVIQDIEDDLRLPCEDCIKSGPKVLNTPSPFPATVQTHFNSTDEFSTQPKFIPDLQSSEEFNCKLKANFMPVKSKPYPVPTYMRTVNCGDLIGQSEHNPYIAEALKKIEWIFQHTKKLKEHVKDFKGSRNDEAYFRLKDILIQHAIKLNNIQCDGCTVLRKKSRQAWQFINTCRTFLESKTLK